MTGMPNQAPIVDEVALRQRFVDEPGLIVQLSAYVGSLKALYPDHNSGERATYATEEDLAQVAASVSARWAVGLTTVVDDPENGWRRAVVQPDRVQLRLGEMEEKHQ